MGIRRNQPLKGKIVMSKKTIFTGSGVAIVTPFDENGVTIPFGQLDVHVKND